MVRPHRITPAETRRQQALAQLGDRVSMARRARGHSQGDLAGLADIGLSTMVAIEAGRPGVALDNLLKVLDALGMLDQFDALLAPAADPVLVQRGVDGLPKRAKTGRRGNI